MVFLNSLGSGCGGLLQQLLHFGDVVGHCFILGFPCSEKRIARMQNGQLGVCSEGDCTFGTSLDKPSTAFQASHLALSFRLKMPGRPNRQNRNVQYGTVTSQKANSACFGKVWNTDVCFDVHNTHRSSTLFSIGKKRLTQI